MCNNDMVFSTKVRKLFVFEEIFFKKLKKNYHFNLLKPNLSQRSRPNPSLTHLISKKGASCVQRTRT